MIDSFCRVPVFVLLGLIFFFIFHFRLLHYLAQKINRQNAKCGKKKGKKNYTKYFKVGKKTGNVKVKKGLKKGTYKVKVKVKAAGNASYNASSWKTVIFKVKVNTTAFSS